MSQPTDTTIRPFSIDIPQSQLDDLKDRLGRAHWPDELPGEGDYGVPQAYVREPRRPLADRVRLAVTREAAQLVPRSSRRRSTARTSISSTCAHPNRTRSRSS